MRRNTGRVSSTLGLKKIIIFDSHCVKTQTFNSLARFHQKKRIEDKLNVKSTGLAIVVKRIGFIFGRLKKND